MGAGAQPDGHPPAAALRSRFRVAGLRHRQCRGRPAAEETAAATAAGLQAALAISPAADRRVSGRCRAARRSALLKDSKSLSSSGPPALRDRREQGPQRFLAVDLVKNVQKRAATPRRVTLPLY